MKNFKKAILIILLAILSFVAFNYVFHKVGTAITNKPGQREFWHAKVNSLFNEIKPGMTREKVTEIIKAQSWPKEMIYADESEIRLRTPFEWLAKNWIVYLEFSEDKLAGARVREESTPAYKHKLSDAPNDIVYKSTN